MTAAATVHALLERHLAGLVERRSLVDDALGSGPSETNVRALLREAGYHDRDDVVGLFTWRGSPAERTEMGACLFWETSWLPTPSWAVEQHRQASSWQQADFGISDATSAERSFPGPAHWLPVAYLDGAEFLAVDCRPDPAGGGVWFCFSQSENVKLFDSLAEALETAIYCVESGLWEVEGEEITCPARSSMPTDNDRDSPPWWGYDDPPSIGLIAPAFPLRFLLVDAPNEGGVGDIAADVASELVAAGCRVVPMSWAQAWELRSWHPRAAIDAARANPTDSSLAVVEVEEATAGCYFTTWQRFRNDLTHQQWLDPDETRLVTAEGFELSLLNAEDESQRGLFTMAGPQFASGGPRLGIGAITAMLERYLGSNTAP